MICIFSCGILEDRPGTGLLFAITSYIMMRHCDNRYLLLAFDEITNLEFDPFSLACTLRMRATAFAENKDQVVT